MKRFISKATFALCIPIIVPIALIYTLSYGRKYDPFMIKFDLILEKIFGRSSLFQPGIDRKFTDLEKATMDLSLLIGSHKNDPKLKKEIDIYLKTDSDNKYMQ